MAKTIYDKLREDHDTCRELMERVIELDGESEERMEVFLQLKQDLLAHSIAEREVYYAPLLRDELTKEKIEHAIDEHEEVRSMLEELEAMDVSSEEWMDRFEELKENVEHHMNEEEHVINQQAGKVLSDKQKTQLAIQYEERKAKAQQMLDNAA